MIRIQYRHGTPNEVFVLPKLSPTYRPFVPKFPLSFINGPPKKVIKEKVIYDEDSLRLGFHALVQWTYA